MFFKLKVYRIRVRLPLDGDVGFEGRAGSEFFVVYHRFKDELGLFLGTKVAGESLSSAFEVVEAQAFPPAAYTWWCEPRVKGEAFLEDPEAVDMHSFLTRLKEGEALAVWAVRDNALVEVLGSRLAGLQERSRNHGGRYDVMYRRLRDKLSGPVYLLNVRVFASFRERAVELTRLLMEHLPMDFGRHVDFRVGCGGASEFFAAPRGIPRFSLFGRGRDRLNMSGERLGKFLIVPNPSLVPVGVARGAPLPDTPPVRSGFRIGVTPSGKPVFLDPEDFERHAYIVGSTGSGKTNLLRVLVDGLRRSDPSSVIVVLDPHGDLAPSVAASYPGSVYFHPTRAPFTVNPLRLPAFSEAEQAKLLGLSNLMEIFEKVFWLGENAVYVRYILQNAMQALYSTTPEPTFSDLYTMILLLRSGDVEASWLAGVSGTDESAVEEKVEFLKKLNSNSFVSALSRLELLATNGVLRRVFGGQDVADDIFLKPGSTICVDTGITDVGEEASYLIMAGFMMKVWYLALASWSAGKKVKVYMVIDEFHRIADLSQVDVMLSEARKYGVHLIMAHQHTGQLTKQAVESVFSNTGVKFMMHSQGSDVERLKSVDRDFQKQLEAVIPNLPKGSAVVFLSPRTPRDTVTPFIVNVDSKRSMEDAGRVYRSADRGARKSTETGRLKPQRGPNNADEVGAGGKGVEEGGGNGVGTDAPADGRREPSALTAGHAGARLPITGAVKYMPRAWPTPLEQDLLFEAYMAGGELPLVDYCTSRAVTRDVVDEASRNLAERGFIKVVMKEGKKTAVYVRGLFDRLEEVAPSEEGYEAAKRVMLKYISSGFYVFPTVRGGSEDAPDLVAVPLKSRGLDWVSAVAIEVESSNEVESHPDQVVWNMKKESTRLFSEVHVYVPKRKLQRVAELAAKAGAGSKVHIYTYPEGESSDEQGAGSIQVQPVAVGEPLREAVKLERVDGSVRFRLNGRRVLVPAEASEILERTSKLKLHTPTIDWERGEVRVESRIGSYTVRFTLDDETEEERGFEVPIPIAGPAAEERKVHSKRGVRADASGHVLDEEDALFGDEYGDEDEPADGWGGFGWPDGDTCDDNGGERNGGGSEEGTAAGGGSVEEKEADRMTPPSPAESETCTPARGGAGSVGDGRPTSNTAGDTPAVHGVQELSSREGGRNGGESADGSKALSQKMVKVKVGGYYLRVYTGGYRGQQDKLIELLEGGRIEGMSLIAADGSRYPILEKRKRD